MKLHAAAASAVLLLGCASLGQLLEDQRWPEACEKAWGSAADQRAVARALAKKSNAHYRLHVFEPTELAELLPYVPAKLSRGEVVLVETAVSVDELPCCSVTVSSKLASSAGDFRPLACCDTGEWLTLDDREDEWRRIQQATTEATIAKERQRERYSGKLGQLRLLWDSVGGATLGLGRDLLWLGTVGVVDVDVSEVSGAQLSPGGWVRTVRKNVEAAMRRRPMPGDASAKAEELAKNRATAALILDQLVRRGSGCEVSGRGGCSSFVLLETSGTVERASADVTFGVCPSGSSASCFVNAESALPLAVGESTAGRINAAFRKPLTLTELVR